MHSSAVRASDRGTKDDRRNTQRARQATARLRLIESTGSWYVKPTSQAACDWIKRNLPGNHPRDQDVRTQHIDARNKKHRVWEVDARFMDSLCRVQEGMPSIKFETFRYNEARQFTALAYPRCGQAAQTGKKRRK